MVGNGTVGATAVGVKVLRDSLGGDVDVRRAGIVVRADQSDNGLDS